MRIKHAWRLQSLRGYLEREENNVGMIAKRAPNLVSQAKTLPRRLCEENEPPPKCALGK